MVQSLLKTRLAEQDRASHEKPGAAILRVITALPREKKI